MIEDREDDDILDILQNLPLGLCEPSRSTAPAAVRILKMLKPKIHDQKATTYQMSC